VSRSKAGREAAPFPEKWLKEPNEVNKASGTWPDTPAKLEAERAGRQYVPSRDDPQKAQ
jgi:hypothetical protein